MNSCFRWNSLRGEWIMWDFLIDSSYQESNIGTNFLYISFFFLKKKLKIQSFNELDSVIEDDAITLNCYQSHPMFAQIDMNDSFYRHNKVSKVIDRVTLECILLWFKPVPKEKWIYLKWMYKCIVLKFDNFYCSICPVLCMGFTWQILVTLISSMCIGRSWHFLL